MAVGVPSFPLFIVGSGRSGSTLLYSILNAHPLIHLQNEADIVPPLLRAALEPWKTRPASEAMGLIDRRVPRRGRGRRFLEASETARRLAGGNDPLDLAAAIEALLRDGSSKPIWGEKSLQLGFVLRPLLAILPETRIVHLVRDPRDSVLSYCEKRRGVDRARASAFRPDWPLARFYAREWDLTQRAIEATKPPRTCLIRYEELVSAPEETVRRICGFLAVEFVPEMLDPAVWRPKLTEGEWRVHANLRRAVTPAQVGRSTRLPRTVLRCIENEAASMGRYGYERDPSRGFNGLQWLLACLHPKKTLSLLRMSRALKPAAPRWTAQETPGAAARRSGTAFS